MFDLGYEINYNTLLIELHKCFLVKKDGLKGNTMHINMSSEKSKNMENLDNVDMFENHDNLLKYEDYMFMISFKGGNLLPEDCLLEIYFMLMTNEFELATTFFSLDLANKLRNDLLKYFIDDESSLIKTILYTNDLIRSAIRSSLERGLDGIAV